MFHQIKLLNYVAHIMATTSLIKYSLRLFISEQIVQKKCIYNVQGYISKLINIKILGLPKTKLYFTEF